MDSEFWLRRWREGRTGWHRDTVLPLLEKHWPALALPPDTTVLVPFCGKTPDMLWLAKKGCRVLGVELSLLAVEQFFRENNLQPTKHDTSSGIHYRDGNIEIIAGDLFDIGVEALSACNAFYDQAALIAQPPDARERYVRQIHSRLPRGSRGLLITFEYPASQMDGPPFSVEEAEVRQLFDKWSISQVARRDIREDKSGFQKAGLSSLHTAVYHLRRL